MLDEIRFILPLRAADFGRAFLARLSAFGTLGEDSCQLTSSDADYLPTVSFQLGDVAVPMVTFVGDQGQWDVALTNDTGLHRGSPHTYGHISLPEYVRRSAALQITALDHVGFDLPWFVGVHPEVLRLRAALAGCSAYHRFPTGEDWDFILPATAHEIAGRELDLSKVRRPKVEIVSIDTVSVPIVQLDVLTDRTYTDLTGLFPEALADPDRRNVWVYLDNPYGVDLCFVLNEDNGSTDWCQFFHGHRLCPPA